MGIPCQQGGHWVEKLINELIIGIRASKIFIEDGSPKDDRPWITLSIKFLDRKWEFL